MLQHMIKVQVVNSIIGSMEVWVITTEGGFSDKRRWETISESGCMVRAGVAALSLYDWNRSILYNISGVKIKVNKGYLRLRAINPLTGW